MLWRKLGDNGDQGDRGDRGELGDAGHAPDEELKEVGGCSEGPEAVEVPCDGGRN